MNQISFWEEESFLKNIDITIIGSGIVGLTCALKIRELKPKSRIVILERGYLPSGASTKNAGFTCFGSPSELLDDLNNLSESEVFQLIELRIKGLEKLKKLIGNSEMNYKEYGSYELFNDKISFENSLSKLPYLNKKLHHIFKEDTYELFNKPEKFGLDKNSLIIKNKFEGQIDTGLMMRKLLKLCSDTEIEIFNGFDVDDFEKQKQCWVVRGKDKQVFTNKLIICNNAFASKLLLNIDLKPARAQVLITKPIQNLKIKGCFHMDKGYYYFRNVDNRVLFGGGRNLDFISEETFNMNPTEMIQNQLESILKTTILPNQNFEIDKRWCGIMGVGKSKSPILKRIDDNLYCGIRMGGMGIALGTEIGQELAKMSINQ